MNIKHCNDNRLGVFDYDADLFELKPRKYLLYIGAEEDGSKIFIPEGVQDCSGMFNGSAIKTAPIIPDSVKSCSSMFSNCQSLENMPVIPESVNDCTNMFKGCSSLKSLTAVPETVRKTNGMFNDCSQDIVSLGEWHLNHRGESLEELLNRNYDADVLTRLTAMQKLTAAEVAHKYEASGKNGLYKRVMDYISSNEDLSMDAVMNELRAADATYERRRNLPRRGRQVDASSGSDTLENGTEPEVSNDNTSKDDESKDDDSDEMGD